MSSRFRCILAALYLAGCGGAPHTSPPTSAPATAPLPAAPGARLGTSATPIRYRVDLTLLPTSDTFTGAVEIDLYLAAATPVIWLNAAEIDVHSAGLVGGLVAHVVPGNPAEDVVGFAFDHPVGPGPVTLRIEYGGKVSSIETQGVFRQKEGDDWYLFSQLESVSARNTFPCLDEPGFKTPWQLTLHVPRDDLAVSNTRQVSEILSADGTMKTVVFAETKPLPTYLVAFGVGPFDVIEAGKSRGGVPVRLIVARGKAEEARWAAQPSVEILSLTEDYFGIPYPYDKLDELTIPKTVGFGAMENAGLITYTSVLITGAKREHDTRQLREFALTAAHEIAHQWFGDLVTMDWWTDTWLNESFASWMESKTYAAWQPTAAEDVESVSTRSRALQLDHQSSSRAIRQPVNSSHDADDAFDFLTYDKGQAIIEMFEAWLGPEVFRRGVHRYLEAHAFGNATATDFFAMLSAEAGHDVAPVFSSFLDQSNAPLITVQPICAAGQPPALHLAQQHFLPFGVAPDGRLWQVPICVRWGGQGSGPASATTGRECLVLTTAEATLPLTSAHACPAWIYANAGGVGYYRTAYDHASLTNLIERGAHSLGAGERVALLGDVAALIGAGKLTAGDGLASVLPLLGDPERHVTSAGIEIFLGLGRSQIPADLKPRWTALIDKIYGPRARALGVAPHPGEDDDTRKLRGDLVLFAGVHGEDPQLLAEARQLATRWLADHAALDRDTAYLALELAAHKGDRAFYDRIRAAVAVEKDLTERFVLLHALGAFRDPALEKETLALLLRPDFDIRDAGAIFGTRGEDQEVRAIGYEFVKAHFDEISAKMPRAMRGVLIGAGGELCSDASLADYQAFFKSRSEKIDGGARTYASTVESIQACSALRKLQEPSIRAFLMR